MKIIPKPLLLVFVTASIVGLVDAMYLTVSHFLEKDVVCSILEGCDIVLKSDYSIIFGVPVALLGFLYYLAILVLIELYIIKKDIFWFKLTAILTSFGFLAYLWFVYLQFFVIEALCFYCLLSAAMTAILFIISLYFFFNKPSVENLEINEKKQK